MYILFFCIYAVVVRNCYCCVYFLSIMMFMGCLNMYTSIVEIVKLYSSKYIVQGEQCEKNQIYSYVFMMCLLIQVIKLRYCVSHICHCYKNTQLLKLKLDTNIQNG